MRYPVLKLIVIVHYVLAGLGLLGVVLFARFGPMRMPGLALLIVGGLVGVAATIAFAEVLKLLMDIEANTRGAGVFAPQAAYATDSQPELRGRAGVAIVGAAVVLTLAAAGLFLT
jgi:hypothetical protein